MTEMAKPETVRSVTINNKKLIKTSDPSISLNTGDVFAAMYPETEVPCPEDKRFRVDILSVSGRAEGIAGLIETAYAENWEEAKAMAKMGLA